MHFVVLGFSSQVLLSLFSPCGRHKIAIATFEAPYAFFQNSRNMASRRKFDFEFKERVLRFAETNSGEKTARHFNIDAKRVRDWKKQREELLLADRRRARLTGGGRKKLSVELERRLAEWISSMKEEHCRVSRNMIKKKALEIYPSVSDGGKTFVASTGWLQKFLERNATTFRHPVTLTEQLSAKLVSFVDHIGKTVRSRGILEKDIIVMDETALCFDVVYPTSGENPQTTRGRKESHLTVVLAAKADGTKLRPYVAFRGADEEMAVLRQQISGAVLTTSANGFMNDTLTADWLQRVLGRFNMEPRLLVWDSYRCHISGTTRAELKRGYDITTAVIPRGCAKHIQATDVMWNQPFKRSLQDAYERWVAGVADKEYTAAGYLKLPARRLLVDWVIAAWDGLDEDLIRESFKVCGLSVKSDGSEDDLIRCFGDGQPCARGREALARLRQQSAESRRDEDNQ
uniref:HTH CENPB-type domain-containing protein n=2 Tax=Dicentrarchus labrax TaxID=13489 RepID=A0A8P4FYH3_DICLA